MRGRSSFPSAIGTTPPGPNVKPAEQLFYDTTVLPKGKLARRNAYGGGTQVRLAGVRTKRTDERSASDT
jgi:hypothetical protein